MKLSQIKVGDVVAVKRGYGDGVRAVVVDVGGWTDVGTKYREQFRKVEGAAHGVAVAIAGNVGPLNDQQQYWFPAVVQPAAVLGLFDDYRAKREAEVAKALDDRVKKEERSAQMRARLDETKAALKATFGLEWVDTAYDRDSIPDGVVLTFAQVDTLLAMVKGTKS